MNREEFEQWLWGEFPQVFETTFARCMISNILDYAQTMPNEIEQYLFLARIIPEISDTELRKFIYKGRE